MMKIISIGSLVVEDGAEVGTAWVLRRVDSHTLSLKVVQGVVESTIDYGVDWDLCASAEAIVTAAVDTVSQVELAHCSWGSEVEA